MSPNPTLQSPKSSTGGFHGPRRDAAIAEASLLPSDDESADGDSPHELDQQFTSDSDKSSLSGSQQLKHDGQGADGAGKAQGASVPVGKRRRVSRACDECRRKKIKCDGKQPCTHCSVYSYECTYDKPSNRRRNPAPQYIEALENRLQRAEALLKKIMPDVDLTDPNLDPMVQQEFHNRNQARAKVGWSAADIDTPSDNQDAQIRSMVGTLGQLDLSDAGEWDFRGTSSGFVFLRRMREHFGFGADNGIPVGPRLPRARGMFQLDSGSPAAGSPSDSDAVKVCELPPKDQAKKLCYYSLNCATCLLRIVHIPSFYEMLDAIYDGTPESYTSDERRYLGLLYAVLALGCMYDYSDDEDNVSYKNAREKGIKYYTASRVFLQDLSECRDITSLQALLFMTMFLQSTSNMADCYAFVGIALRSALRMGLHRRLPHAKLTPIADETRRRVFHVIRQMDVYISTILGFPIMLQEEDIDQPYPTEVDDQYITKDAILTPPPGTISFFQAFNAHSRLMSILVKVIKNIYPLPGVVQSEANGEISNPYMISYSRIKDMERELHEWYAQLPTPWRPSPDGPVEVIRVRMLLRFAYAQVQTMLYRPFLHYMSPRLSGNQGVDERYFACAAAGISVCRNVVHIGIEIRKQGVLIGPYWFILWTQFFSILALVFYVVENQDKPGSSEILADAQAGRDVLASLAERSSAAERVTNALQHMFERLPERMKKAKTGKRPAPTKKRSAPGTGGKLASVPMRPNYADSSQRRPSEDVSRSKSAGPGKQGPPVPHRTTSFDAGGATDSSSAAQSFLRAYQDLIPVDIAAAHSGPGPARVAAGSRHASASLASAQAANSTANPIHKLNAMMFQPADPFAYPTQPVGAANAQRSGAAAGGGHHGAGNQSADSMQFYMTNLYEDIDGQLLGSIPPYLVHAGGQTTPHGMDLSSQFFGTPAMPTLGQDAGNSHERQQAAAHAAAAAAAHQRQQRDFDELQMLADPAFRGNWDLGGGQNYRPL